MTANRPPRPPRLGPTGTGSSSAGLQIPGRPASVSRGGANVLKRNGEVKGKTRESERERESELGLEGSSRTTETERTTNQ